MADPPSPICVGATPMLMLGKGRVCARRETGTGVGEGFGLLWRSLGSALRDPHQQLSPIARVGTRSLRGSPRRHSVIMDETINTIKHDPCTETLALPIYWS